jgi:hypothetical protein
MAAIVTEVARDRRCIPSASMRLRQQRTVGVREVHQRATRHTTERDYGDRNAADYEMFRAAIAEGRLTAADDPHL